jgi:hypothetical protein
VWFIGWRGRRTFRSRWWRNIARSARRHVDRFLHRHIGRNRPLWRQIRIINAIVDRIRRNQRVGAALAAPAARAKYFFVNGIAWTAPEVHSKRIFDEAEHFRLFFLFDGCQAAARLASNRYATMYRQMVCQRPGGKTRASGNACYGVYGRDYFSGRNVRGRFSNGKCRRVSPLAQVVVLNPSEPVFRAASA